MGNKIEIVDEYDGRAPFHYSASCDAYNSRVEDGEWLWLVGHCNTLGGCSQFKTILTI